MLTYLKAIQRHGNASQDIRFEWDDWSTDPVGVIDEGDDEDDADVADVAHGPWSHRANVAMVLAATEWIIYRFSRLSTDIQPLQCMEAGWAQMIDRTYSWEWDLDGDWTGPVKGPIKEAVGLAGFAIREAWDDADTNWCRLALFKLANYVLADDAFTRWTEEVERRLLLVSPLRADDHLGDVVPREAMSPEDPFDPKQTEPLINRYLGSLDYRANPFLNPPKNMYEDGFEGTPYLFDIGEDRRRRQEW